MIQTMIGLAAALAVLIGQPGPAHVASGTSLTFTYQGKKAKLTCDPAGGGHPRATQVCATLHGVGGNPSRLKGGDSLCVLLYRPVTAQIKGTWQGRTVRWQQTYGNSCEMNRATGVLFDF